MLELRILSGLHRGATLPLDDDTVVIGTDESAGIVLLDPGIEGMHASLRRTSEGWALSPLDGDVYGADTNEPLESLDMRPGEFGRIGRVWVSVVDARTVWDNPPPDPIDIEADDLHGDDALDADLRADDAVTDMHDTLERTPADDGTAPVDGADDKTDDVAPPAGGKRKKLALRLALPVIACAIALVAWGTHQFAMDTSGDASLKPGTASAKTTQPTAGADPAKLVDAAISAAAKQEELRSAFRKRLAEVDLLKSFDLNLRDNAWTMHATLDDDEVARFERTLGAFVTQHKITFPITAKVGNAEHMLPFKIRQVISGANASVITLDGNRLYVGDEYLGLRLVSIKGSWLTFQGKRKIEVRW